TSEWPAALVREAHAAARAHHLQPPTMEQPQYSLLHRQRVELEYAPLYAELGMGITTWSPLASGLLAGRYDHGIPDDSRLGREPGLQSMVLGGERERMLERARRFTALAAALGLRPSALAIAWCLRNPHVSTVILGASRVSQLLENLEALELPGRIQDESVWKRIAAASAD